METSGSSICKWEQRSDSLDKGNAIFLHKSPDIRVSENKAHRDCIWVGLESRRCAACALYSTGLSLFKERMRLKIRRDLFNVKEKFVCVYSFREIIQGHSSG